MKNKFKKLPVHFCKFSQKKGPNPPPPPSIHKVHDEVKDKAYELELTWLCDESGRAHQHVPDDLAAAALAAAKASLEAEEMAD